MRKNPVNFSIHFTGPLKDTYNTGGGGISFGPTNGGVMLNGQNTGTMTNNMMRSADKETDIEAKEKGETTVFFVAELIF